MTLVSLWINLLNWDLLTNMWKNHTSRPNYSWTKKSCQIINSTQILFQPGCPTTCQSPRICSGRATRFVDRNWQLWTDWMFSNKSKFSKLVIEYDISTVCTRITIEYNSGKKKRNFICLNLSLRTNYFLQNHLPSTPDKLSKNHIEVGLTVSNKY